MRRVLPAFLLAMVFTTVSISLALAATPVHDRFRIDETFDDVLCGIDVTSRLEIKGNALIFEGRILDLSQVRLTWTNADGDWLQNSVTGQVAITEELDGDILTVTATNRGVHERLRSSNGITAAFDRGQIVFRDVIDLNDLADEEDDVLLSSEILFQAGPHPEADSGFELFCETVIDVLG